MVFGFVSVHLSNDTQSYDWRDLWKVPPISPEQYRSSSSPQSIWKSFLALPTLSAPLLLIRLSITERIVGAFCLDMLDWIGQLFGCSPSLCSFGWDACRAVTLISGWSLIYGLRGTQSGTIAQFWPNSCHRPRVSSKHCQPLLNKHPIATTNKKSRALGSAPNHKRTNPVLDLAAHCSFWHRILSLSKPMRISHSHQNLLTALLLLLILVGYRFPNLVELFLRSELLSLFYPGCVVSLKAKLSIDHSLLLQLNFLSTSSQAHRLVPPTPLSLYHRKVRSP